MARSLTKLDKAENSYVRPARVEANIDGVLAQSASDLINRLAVCDQKSPDFIMAHLYPQFWAMIHQAQLPPR